MSTSACCPPDSIGPAPLSKKETKGQMVELLPLTVDDAQKLKPMPAYITGKQVDASYVVVVFSDVFGIDSGNHKVVCDELAERLGDDNTLVIMPDLFRGCPIIGGWGGPFFVQMAFALPSIIFNINMRTTAANIERDLQSIVMPYLKGTTAAPNTKIACVGFCFGGWVVGRALANSELQYDLGVAIHPSWRVECVSCRRVETLASRVGTKPILFLPSRSDNDCKMDSPTIKQLAKQRNIEPSEMVVEFPNMKHGWVTRGDDTDLQVAEDIQKALKLTVKFIKDANI